MEDEGSGQVMHPQIPAPLQQLLDEMTEADTRKRPKSVEQVWLRLRRIKLGKWGWIWNFLQGMLLGATPVALFVFAFVITKTQGYESAFFALSLLFFCLFPIGALILLIIAISMLFSPRRRLVGLGILTTMTLFLLVVAHQWILPLFGVRF